MFFSSELNRVTPARRWLVSLRSSTIVSWISSNHDREKDGYATRSSSLRTIHPARYSGVRDYSITSPMVAPASDAQNAYRIASKQIFAAENKGKDQCNHHLNKQSLVPTSHTHEFEEIIVSVTEPTEDQFCCYCKTVPVGTTTPSPEEQTAYLELIKSTIN